MENILFIGYQKCSTARKAEKFLLDNGIPFTKRDIVSDNPTAEELRRWHKASDLPLRRFFNTSGILYREGNVKKKLDEGMTDEAAYQLLASNGLLVKRPIVVADGFVLVGFREDEWREKLLVNPS